MYNVAVSVHSLIAFAPLIQRRRALLALAIIDATLATVAELKGRILDWLITSTETDQIARRWQV